MISGAAMKTARIAAPGPAMETSARVAIASLARLVSTRHWSQLEIGLKELEQE